MDETVRQALEAMNHRLGQQEERIQQLTAENQRLEQQAQQQQQVQQAQAQQQQQQPQQGGPQAAAARMLGLVGTRIPGKSDQFAGEAAKFQD